MIRHATTLTVPDVTAEKFYDFMINPDNDRYREWWPKEHMAFYVVKFGDKNHLDDTVYYDEYLGETRRLKFFAIVTIADRPAQIAWQMKKAGLRLPATLNVKFSDTPDGLRINHELRVGFNGIGKILDLFLRFYLTKSFEQALEKHCLEEWPRLAKYLRN